MNDTQWLQDLTVGSKVIISEGRVQRVCTVTKATATQVHIKRTEVYTQKFRKSDGTEVSSDAYGRAYLIEASTERLLSIADKVKRSKLAIVIRDCDMNTLSTDQMARIAAIMQEEGK